MVVGLAVAAAVAGAIRGGFKDLLVYQYAGQWLLDGLSVYDLRDPVNDLPFTYPPFGAVAAVPLSWLPAWLAAALWTGASVAALAVVVVLVRRALGHPTSGWLVAALTVGALALEPVWQTLTFGQVNLLLMLAVLVDLLHPERRWSGVLVGITAGVKLTPLVFVVLLVLVGRRTAAGRALATFAGTVVIGFLAMPGAGSDLLDRRARRRRPGRAPGTGPQPVGLRRADPAARRTAADGAVADRRRAAGVGVLLVGAAWWRRGERVLGTCLAAVSMLLASPVSWSHHWVWAVPVALVLWERHRWGAVAWTAVFVARPILWPPWGEHREYGWSPAEHLIGNGYVLAALIFAAWAAVALARQAATEKSSDGGVDPGGRRSAYGVTATPRAPARPTEEHHHGIHQVRTVHLARRRHRGARDLALPLLRRPDGRRRRRADERQRRHAARPPDLRRVRRATGRPPTPPTR